MPTSPTVFADAAAFLQSRIDYERAISIPYGQRVFKLDRMRELLARLGNPQDQLQIVHVAGTKGKGSTSAMIASALASAGYRVGLYTSPHLERVEERLSINGVPCPSDRLEAYLGRIKPIVEELDQAASGDPAKGEHGPTYFEVVTALGFCHFAAERTDCVVLEVGLGGRLDSTNVCRPQLAVITSISYDHTNLLGETLAEIAGEKAGIIKPGAPVVSGVRSTEPREVIVAAAREQGSRLLELGADFDFVYHPPHGLESADACGTIDFVDRAPNGWGQLFGVKLGLIGAHQGANAAVALAALGELRRQGWRLPLAAVTRGLAETRWPARLEIVGRRPTIVLDTAHNVASIEALLVTLEESFAARRRVLVFATSRDKDARGMLARLLPCFDQVVLTCYVNNPRSAAPETLATLARELGSTPLQVCDDPVTAWQAARKLVGPDDLLVMTGSFFVAAEMRVAMRADAE
jgi:dihydrofolate synthase/folylpolyglutamate synthase